MLPSTQSAKAIRVPPLASGGAGAPGERHAGDAEADGVVRGIAEEIQRIGLQRRRTGSGAGDDLGHEESRH